MKQELLHEDKTKYTFMAGTICSKSQGSCVLDNDKLERRGGHLRGETGDCVYCGRSFITGN